MALTVGQVFTRARDILTDQAGTRWPTAELGRYLDDARLTICTLRPDLYAAITDITLVAGVRQSLPADGVRLIDVLCNVTGTAPSSPLRITSKEVLDAQNPLWPVSTGTPKNFMYDERYPRVFHISPGAIANTKLRIVYAQAPGSVGVDEATELSFQEGMYTTALVDFICYRAYMKNATFGANSQRAQAHYQMFQQTLGVGNAVGLTTSPNTSNDGGAIPRSAAAAA